MASSVENVPLGTCDVYFTPNGEQEEINLGHTIGGCEGVYAPEYHESKVDKYTGVVERFLIGEEFGANVPLAETSQIEVIKRAIPHGTDEGDTLYIGKKAGARSSLVCGRLRLHPIANEPEDRSEDWVILRAHVNNEVTLGFKNDGERIAEVQFRGIVDEGQEDGKLLGYIGEGDES